MESKEILIKQDFIIDLATDGETAFSKVDEFQPQLIVIDLKMPELGGSTFLKMVKQFNSEVEVIVLTGSTNFDFYEEWMASGAFCWVTKPLNMNSLILNIYSALTLSSVKDEMASGKSKNRSIRWHN